MTTLADEKNQLNEEMEEQQTAEQEEKEEMNQNEEVESEQAEAPPMEDEGQRETEEQEKECISSEKEKELKNQIAELENKLEELENRYLRLHADFENYRRRSKLDFEAAQKYRAQSLISDILPVIDNFERALKVETKSDETKSILQGMDMIYKSLVEALKKEGVEPIESVGKEFDPKYHQAVMQVNEEGYGSNIVVEEFQKGYILKDRVIRPSMVKVNQ